MTATISRKLKPPRTLTIDEEVALVGRAQSGDETAIQALVTQYIPLIKSTCRRYPYKDALELEDLQQQCIVYLIEAIPKYNLESGNKFVSFLVPQFRQLSRYIMYHGDTIKRPYNEITIAREERSVSAIYSLDRNAQNDDDTTDLIFHPALVDSDINFTEFIEHEQARDILYGALELLDPRDAEWVMMYYLEEMTLVQIAKQYKISVYTVGDRVRKAVLELKANMLNKC